MSRNPFTSAFSAVAQRCSRWRQSLLRFRRGSFGTLKGIGSAVYWLSLLAAMICVFTLVIYAGFDHSATEYRMLHKVLRATQAIFLAQIICSETISGYRSPALRNRVFHWLVELPVLLTFVPLLYHRPVEPWIPALARILYSNIFLYISLTVYSTVMISLGTMRLVNRRTNPSLMLSVSFLVIILLGSFLLSLPKCNLTPISYADALFVSTSAVCITGLTPVDVATQFTPLGILVLGLLIQTGALGVMTFTYFFALFFTGNSTIFSQLMLRDVIYTRSLNELIPALLYILGFTLAVEAIGAVAIFWSVNGTLGLSDSDTVIFAAFHSVSSFCNAGFSTLPGGMSNPSLLYGNLSIYWITTLLVIAGAIGFPILVNFKDAIFSWMRSRFTRGNLTPVHIYNMNTKIVLSTFTLIFTAGAVLFYILEYDNTLAGMTQAEKITQSVFNSAVPRSAGFSSVDPARFLNPTLLIVMFLMWVGGASQSTAGGIKVNTLAAICCNLRAIVTGAPYVNAFRRNIAVRSIRRANAVVALSIFSYVIFSLLLLWLEPRMPARDLLFEMMSALFTVGSSLGATPLLCDKSHLLLCVAMFLGRVGIISLLTGMIPSRDVPGVRYPEGEIIIS